MVTIHLLFILMHTINEYIYISVSLFLSFFPCLSLSLSLSPGIRNNQGNYNINSTYEHSEYMVGQFVYAPASARVRALQHVFDAAVAVDPLTYDQYISSISFNI